MKYCVNDSESKFTSFEKQFGAKLVIDGNFTTESDKFVSFDAFSHNKIEQCLSRFLINGIDLSIDGDSQATRNDISFSCDVYYIENIIKLQDQLKIHFISQILHKPNDIKLANDIYNILGLLISDTENEFNPSRHGAVSILRNKTSSDTDKFRLQSHCSIDIDGSIHAGAADAYDDDGDGKESIGNGELDHIKLSSNGQANFLKMISKTLKIAKHSKNEKNDIGIKFVTTSSSHELTKYHSNHGDNEEDFLSKIRSTLSIRSSNIIHPELSLAAISKSANSKNNSKKDLDIDVDIEYGDHMHGGNDAANVESDEKVEHQQTVAVGSNERNMDHN